MVGMLPQIALQHMAGLQETNSGAACMQGVVRGGQGVIGFLGLGLCSYSEPVAPPEPGMLPEPPGALLPPVRTAQRSPSRFAAGARRPA